MSEETRIDGEDTVDETQVQDDQPDNFDVGQGDQFGGGEHHDEVDHEDDPGDGPGNDAPPAPPEEEEAPSNTTQSIANRLGEQAGGGEEEQEEDAPVAKSPIPFDIGSLSREQLQALKAALDSTPDANSRKKGNPKVTLRKYEGKLIMDFKNARLGIVKDHELNRDVERHLIPVKFQGEDDYTSMLYSDFINAERVPCEVIDHKESKKEIPEGEVFSRKQGRMIEMVRTEVKSYFTIKLPDGTTTEIEGKMANA